MKIPRPLLMLAALAAVGLRHPALGAQDTLSLGALRAAAIARDARAVQPELLQSASDRRVTSLQMERRPQFSLNGSLSHQSDVTALQLPLSGASVPVPPKDRWQATLDAQQLLYDGGAISARANVERARLAESSASVESARYRVLAEVNGAFFNAYLHQQRVRELELLISDLDARLAVARARVAGGVALPRDTAAIVAEQLQALISRDGAVASRRAALSVLSQLTGRAIADSAELQLPDLSLPLARAAEAPRPPALRNRPEFRQFESTRFRLDREAELARLQNRPRVVAFGQAGFGRPGLNQLRPDAAALWLTGVRVEWRPWTWRSAERAVDALQIQQQVVVSEEQALADELARAVAADSADMAALRTALVTDARVLQLRTVIEQQARAQFGEGVITAAEYVTARTDVLEARLNEVRHRAQLVQAEARYLTTLGFPIPNPFDGAP